MNNKAAVTVASNGEGFLSLLALVFIVMKLMGWGTVATWSWWWVLAPLWAPIVFGIAVITIFFIFAGIIGALNK